ncbi:MAG: 4'-phosphopantetheinyl transferase family protein [Hyphomicrobiales bacterium]
MPSEWKKMLQVNRSDDHRVIALFAAGSVDITPVSARHVASVFYMPVSNERETTLVCAMVLSDEERQRAGCFAAESDRTNFIQRRAFRRYCGAKTLGDLRQLSEITFSETDNGRPYLQERPDCWFSFSSCSTGFLGAWSASHGIGVDIENQTGQIEAVEMASHFFSKAEAEVVERHTGTDRKQAFFHFWCLKEAALKSIGEGLPVGLNAFEFKLSPEPHVVRTPAPDGGSKRFTAHLISRGTDCAALITRTLV